MSLSALKKPSLESLRDALADAKPVVARLQPDEKSVLVMFGHAGAPANSVLPILEMPGTTGGSAISTVLQGRKQAGTEREIPKSSPGDVLIFDAATAFRGELLCSHVVARMHDGMEGEVQAMRMLARPSRAKVGENGAYQFVTLLDPAKARKVTSKDEFLAFAKEIAGQRWPGGKPGFLVRNANKAFMKMTEGELRENAEIFPDDRESMEAFARRIVDVNGLLAQGPMEFVPAFLLPLSKEHMWREGIDVTKPREMAQVGKITERYAISSKFRGFAPSFVLVGKDDEWAFKAKTGRKVATCFALQPLDAPIEPRNIHSPVRGKAEKVSKTLSLYQSAEQWASAAAQRDARRPAPAEPVPAATPPRPAPAGRSGVLSSLPRRPPPPPVKPLPSP